MKVILFDLDGTLVKAGGAGRKALDRAAQALYGVAQVCEQFSLAGRTDKQNFHLAHLKATGKKPSSHAMRRLQRTYLQYLPNEVRKAVRTGRYEEIRGISKLLRTLAKRRDAMLGLGTGNLPEGAHIKLKPSGFMRYFAFGGFGSDGYSRVRMLRQAVRRACTLSGQKIKPENVFVIGDTPKDIQAGKALGYRTGVVTSGFGEIDAIRRSNPEAIAKDFGNTKYWLGWITAGRPSRKYRPLRRRGKRSPSARRRLQAKIS